MSMTTHDVSRDTPDWKLPPRCCGTWSSGLTCDVCKMWLPIPKSIELGEN